MKIFKLHKELLLTTQRSHLRLRRPSKWSSSAIQGYSKKFYRVISRAALYSLQSHKQWKKVTETCYFKTTVDHTREFPKVISMTSSEKFFSVTTTVTSNLVLLVKIFKNSNSRVKRISKSLLLHLLFEDKLIIRKMNNQNINTWPDSDSID